MAKTLDDKVPYAPHLTYRDLCMVKRAPYGTPLKRGCILARRGGWNEKRVVVDVTYCGVVEIDWYGAGKVSRHQFAVSVLPLGKINATGKAKISSRKDPMEVMLHLSDPNECSQSLGSWFIVQPIGQAPKAVRPKITKGAESFGVPSVPIPFPAGKGLNNLAYAPQSKAKAESESRHAQDPCAVLDQFALTGGY